MPEFPHIVERELHTADKRESGAEPVSRQEWRQEQSLTTGLCLRCFEAALQSGIGTRNRRLGRLLLYP